MEFPFTTLEKKNSQYPSKGHRMRLFFEKTVELYLIRWLSLLSGFIFFSFLSFSSLFVLNMLTWANSLMAKSIVSTDISVSFLKSVSSGYTLCLFFFSCVLFIYLTFCLFILFLRRRSMWNQYC